MAVLFNRVGPGDLGWIATVALVLVVLILTPESIAVALRAIILRAARPPLNPFLR